MMTAGPFEETTNYITVRSLQHQVVVQLGHAARVITGLYHGYKPYKLAELTPISIVGYLRIIRATSRCPLNDLVDFYEKTMGAAYQENDKFWRGSWAGKGWKIDGS